MDGDDRTEDGGLRDGADDQQAEGVQTGPAQVRDPTTRGQPDPGADEDGDDEHPEHGPCHGRPWRWAPRSRMAAMTSDEVLTAVEGAVATVTINRPAQRNALSPTVTRGLRAALRSVGDDQHVRVVVLRGAGDRAFCAGADLSTLGAGAGFLELHEARGAIAGLCEDLWSLGKPTIARIQGYALAGGFGLALACDLLVAAAD